MKKINQIKFILPDENRFCANFSTFETKGLRLSHLGLLIIGEMLRKEKNCTVEGFDEKIKPVSMTDLEGADLVGISIQTIAAVRTLTGLRSTTAERAVYRPHRWLASPVLLPCCFAHFSARIHAQACTFSYCRRLAQTCDLLTPPSVPLKREIIEFV